MSSVKEADQLKHAGKVVSVMEKKDHNQPSYSTLYIRSGMRR